MQTSSHFFVGWNHDPPMSAARGKNTRRRRGNKILPFLPLYPLLLPLSAPSSLFLRPSIQVKRRRLQRSLPHPLGSREGRLLFFLRRKQGKRLSRPQKVTFTTRTQLCVWMGVSTFVHFDSLLAHVKGNLNISCSFCFFSSDVHLDAVPYRRRRHGRRRPSPPLRLRRPQRRRGV